MDVWKTIAVFLAGAMSAMLPLLWSMTRRPTFTQVETMITRDMRIVEERFIRLDETMNKVDRHVDEIKEKVQTILIDVEAQRQMRARAAMEDDR